MHFYIRKNSTLPLLIMQLVQDGRNDYMSFHEKIQNANILFSMVDTECEKIKVFCKKATLLKKEICEVDCQDEYYIAYKFDKFDTNKSGIFKGEFKIEFLDGSGTLIAPIREDLFIHVLDGFTK